MDSTLEMLASLGDEDTQQLARAGIKRSIKDIRRDFSTLAAELWQFSSDERFTEEERENLAAWVARLSWYTSTICQVFEATDVLLANNVQFVRLATEHMKQNPPQSDDVDETKS